MTGWYELSDIPLQRIPPVFHIDAPIVLLAAPISNKGHGGGMGRRASER